MILSCPLLRILVTSCYIITFATAEKRAIVSFMLRNKGGLKYKKMRELFLYSLRKTGYQGAIVFILAGNGDLDPDDASLFKQYVVETKSVSLINQNVGVVDHGVKVYDGTLSKLHLWGLIEYDQILYYDSDFVFLKDPSSAFNVCGTANLCASVDRLIASNGGQGYFNSGFLVLRPDADSFTNLVKNKGMADGKYFPDQDLLNEYFKGKWTSLSSDYNHMHCNQFSSPNRDVTIAMHEKEHILKSVYPEDMWVWNTFKSTLGEPQQERTVPMMSTPQQRLVSFSSLPPEPQQLRQSVGGSTMSNRYNQRSSNTNQLETTTQRTSIRGRPEMLPPWIAPPPPPPSIAQSNARIDVVEAVGSSYRSPHRIHGKVSVPVTMREGAVRGVDFQQPPPQQLQSQQSPPPLPPPQQQQLQQQQQQQQQLQRRQQQLPVAAFGSNSRNRATQFTQPVPLPLPVPFEQRNHREGGTSMVDRRVVEYGRAQGNMGLPGQAADKIATIDNGPTRPDVLSRSGRYRPNTNRVAIA